MTNHTATVSAHIVPVPRNLRELLVGCIENASEDYDVPVNAENLATELWDNAVFQDIKAHVAGEDVLEVDTDIYNETIWALYDYAENVFADRGWIE